jgi:hypothetical protein
LKHWLSCSPAFGERAVPLISPPPPLPPLPLERHSEAAAVSEGVKISINCEALQAPWRWQAGSPPRLWLPLDLLETRLSLKHSTESDGSLRLRWHGQERLVPAARLRTLQDEVGLEVGDLLLQLGGTSQLTPLANGSTGLSLQLPAALLQPLAKQPNSSAPLPAAGSGPQMEQKLMGLGSRRHQLSFVRFDPRRSPYALVPLSRNSMEGLGSLLSLARSQGALAALNGGFFNRIRALPLGGLRDQGDWLSGPILNRGAMAWQRGQMPRFSRVRLDEWLLDGEGKRLALTGLNSGWSQRGLARYTRLWGPVYRPITGGESGVMIDANQVSEILSPEQLNAGVALRQGQTLLVSRGGAPLPLRAGEAVRLERRLSPEQFSDLPYLIQGGPLLLNAGQVVLDGAAENFSPAFMDQRAPRSIVASDADQLWLIAIEGVDDAGPTLVETAELLRQLGLQYALNLDGGSSTNLMVEGRGGITGRGFGAAIHNGLGIVLSPSR